MGLIDRIKELQAPKSLSVIEISNSTSHFSCPICKQKKQKVVLSFGVNSNLRDNKKEIDEVVCEVCGTIYRKKEL